MQLLEDLPPQPEHINITEEVMAKMIQNANTHIDISANQFDILSDDILFSHMVHKSYEKK